MSGGISTGLGETFWDITCNIIYFDFKFIFQKKAVYCLNILVEHVVSCKGFRVRRNCKGLSLIILVRLLQVARGSGELDRASDIRGTQ